METRQAYLDTTALAARVSQDKHAFPQLTEKLRSYSSKITSQYVLMEIRRGILRYLVYLYHCALEADSLAEVHRRVERLLADTPKPPAKDYAPKPSHFFRRNPEYALSRGRGTRYRWNHRHLYAAGHSRPAPYANTQLLGGFAFFPGRCLNELGCYQILKGPVQIGDRFDATLRFCENLEARCKVAEFCENHKTELVRVLAALSESPRDSETEFRIQALTSVLSDYSRARNHTTCWHLAGLYRLSGRKRSQRVLSQYVAGTLLV